MNLEDAAKQVISRLTKVAVVSQKQEQGPENTLKQIY
jgi:hypothetical protein